MLKALCITLFFSFYAIGCGSLDSVNNEVIEHGGPLIVSIESGGSIEIPEGALPVWDEVTVETTVTPILPDDVVPLGNAYLIRSSTELSKPVILKLPIPDGVQDISSLAIVRVEENGTTSLLTAYIEGNEVIARTPGFSTFVVAEKIIAANKIKVRYINVYGRDSLHPGEITSYSVRPENTFSGPSNQSMKLQDIEWTITGPFQVVQIRGLSIIIKADSKAGSDAGDIAISFLDSISGYQYSGTRKVRVQLY